MRLSFVHTAVKKPGQSPLKTTTSEQIPPGEIPNPDSHYLQRVSSVGESETVVASADIYSQKGVLLLKAGMPINRKSFLLLSKHKLANPVDESISISDQLTNHTIYIDARRQLSNNPLLRALLPCINNPLELQNCIRHLPLTPIMRTKISMAKKSARDIYEHSLRVAIGAAMIGYFQGFSQTDCEHLAAAGLFHDLGMLHIDPSFLDSERTLNAEEMRFVHSHPLIMFLMMQDSDVYHPCISVPILEHHERLWGNGYPKGIKTFSSPLSSVLALTEVLISLADRGPLDHVLEIIKVQQDMFETATVKALFSAITEVKTASIASRRDVTEQEFIAKIEQFSRICQGWLTLVEEMEAMAERDAQATKLLRWMAMLERMLTRTGVDMAHIDQLREAQMMEHRQEYDTFISEGLYQLNQIVCAVSHYCLLHPSSPPATCKPLMAWLSECDRELQSIWRQKQLIPS